MKNVGVDDASQRGKKGERKKLGRMCCKWIHIIRNVHIFFMRLATQTSAPTKSNSKKPSVTPSTPTSLPTTTPALVPSSNLPLSQRTTTMGGILKHVRITGTTGAVKITAAATTSQQARRLRHRRASNSSPHLPRPHLPRRVLKSLW